MGFRTTVCLLAAALFTSLAGCGTTHTTSDDAGPIVFDANFPDTGVDAGPPPSNVGSPCSSDADCTAPATMCLPEPTGLPGGYCTLACVADDECPMGSVCTQIDGANSICLVTCDPAGTDQCRAGYGCAGGGGIPVCLPGCEDDSDCATGLLCQVGGGFGGAGACYDPASNIGDPCVSADECPAGGFCRDADQGWPDGACVGFGCDFDTNTGCPTGSECVLTGRFASCVDDCTTDTDCRTGYQCIPTLGFADRLTCQPNADPGSLGVPCSQRRNPCLGGICQSEGDYGFADSYCIALGCDASVSPTGCPGDGVCFMSDSGVGICFDGCTADTDCRTGYHCRPSDSEDPSSPLGCLPGCENDGECSNMGAVCNTGTGLCGDAFAEASLGEPCATDDDCIGGRCLSETEDGWPAGTCTYPGCRLSGTGMMSTCPGTSACADDGGGDPELGVCVDSCVVGGAVTCRAGYACTTGVGGGGVCTPSCTASDCGTGRTCNPTSGLCE